jgi:hypothetical protein
VTHGEVVLGSSAGSRLAALYPRAWRARYGDELEALLEGTRLGFRERVDLVRGAIDAHLHPAQPSPLPVLAAVTGSALATSHALVLAAQPTQTDWPGYVADALPLAIGSVAALVPALVGLWLKLGDADGAFGRIGLVLAVAGHGAWLVALLAAVAHVEYGSLTAAAATVAMAGTAALGVALVGRSRVVLGLLLAVAGLAGIAPPALGWPLFAGAWSVIALRLAIDFAGPATGDRGALHAG